MHSVEHGGPRSETWERHREREREGERKGVRGKGERVREPPTICPSLLPATLHYTQLNCKPATVT